MDQLYGPLALVISAVSENTGKPFFTIRQILSQQQVLQNLHNLFRDFLQVYDRIFRV